MPPLCRGWQTLEEALHNYAEKLPKAWVLYHDLPGESKSQAVEMFQKVLRNCSSPFPASMWCRAWGTGTEKELAGGMGRECHASKDFFPLHQSIMRS